MKLKNKILSGFFIVILMLIASGAVTIYEFTRLSNSVSSMLNDNYRTISACNTMLEAIDKMDENIMKNLINNNKFDYDIKKFDSLFNVGLQITKNNLTEINEDKYIKEIENSYILLKKHLNSDSLDNSNSLISFYHNNLKQKINNVNNSITQLLELNQKNMFITASTVEEQAEKALMPGIIAIIAGIVFSVVFNYFINIYIVNPISIITKNINNFYNDKRPFTHNLKTKDEIQELYDSVEKLTIDISSK